MNTRKKNKKNKIYKTPYHEAYALIRDLNGHPDNVDLLRRMMSVVFGIVMADPESTATQGEEANAIYRGFSPAFRFESIDRPRSAAYPGRYAVISGGRMENLTDDAIPYGRRYVSFAASNGRSYRHFKISMRRFSANLKSIDECPSISAYCMLRGIDLTYEPR